MEHIIKEYNEKYNFWVLKAEEGYVISSWNEGDDIINYNSFTIAYCPYNADFDCYHAFTVEQDEAYKEEQRKKQEEDEKELDKIMSE